MKCFPSFRVCTSENHAINACERECILIFLRDCRFDPSGNGKNILLVSDYAPQCENTSGVVQFFTLAAPMWLLLNSIMESLFLLSQFSTSVKSVT